MWAGSHDVAVRQEAAIGWRVDLLQHSLFDQAVAVEAPEEVLRQRVVRGRRRATEVIEGETEATIDVGLDCMLAFAVVGDIEPRRGGRQFCGCAVFVGGADEQRLVADLPPEARVDVCRQ